MPLPNTTAANAFAQYYYTKVELNAGQLDNLYFGEDEFINTSAGAGDAGKPIKLNSSGQVDASMIAGGSLATHIADTTTHGTSGDIVGTTDTQTLSNKTLAGATVTNTMSLYRTGTGATLTLYDGTDANAWIIYSGVAGAGEFSIYDVDATTHRFRITSAGAATINSSLNVTSSITQNSVPVVTTTGSQTLTNKTLTAPSMTTPSVTGAAAKMTINASSGSPSIAFAVSSTEEYGLYYNASSGYFAISETGVGDHLVVENGGNVGIGVTNPSNKLEVNGTIEATAVTVGGVSVVTTTGTQTLTNKTLTAPVISTISNSGTITLPTGNRTLVARDTTDTLTNKTLTSPAMTGATTNTLVASTSVTAPTVYGSSSANGDIAIHGTSNATKATSYVQLNPGGGDVVVGGTTTDFNFEIQDAGATNYRMTFNLDTSNSENVIGSINDTVGSFTPAQMRIFCTRLRMDGIFHISNTLTPTGTADATGSVGDIAVDDNYIYRKCTAGWGRIAWSFAF